MMIWLEEQKLRSERYLKLKEAEAADSVIQKSFDEPVKMTVFTWKNGGGDTDTLMSPMDSIKHYFLMLNTGFMAMDHSNGHIKAWVVAPILNISNTITSFPRGRWVLLLNPSSMLQR